MDLLGFSDDLRDELSAALMQAHIDAAKQLRQDLAPLAQRIFNGDGNLLSCVPDNTTRLTPEGCISLIDHATERYVTQLQTAALTTIDDLGERNFRTFTATATEEGWLSAGSWFYRLAAISDYINKLALNVPEPYEIRAWQRLPTEDVETYAGRLMRLQAVLTEAETDSGLGLTEGDPNNTQIDDISRGMLRMTLDLLQGGVLGSAHPLFSIAWIGHALLAAVLATLFTAKIVGSLFAGGKVAKATGALIDSLLSTVNPTASLTLTGLVLGVILLALIGFALTAAIYLPLIPFIIWSVGVLHWLLLVFEAMLAAPIWAVWFLRNGESLTSEMMNGYLLLFSLLLRPVLMVFGLLGATLISYYLLSWLQGAFLAASVNAASGNFTGLVVVTGTFIVFMIVTIEVTLKCFSLIHRLPDFVLRWVGGAMDNAIDAADVRARSEAAANAGARAATDVLGKVMGGAGAPGARGGTPEVKDMQSKSNQTETSSRKPNY